MNKFKTTTTGRIDKILAETLDVSRNQVEKLIKDGLVSVNGKTITKTSYKIEEGDEVAMRSKKQRNVLCLL